MADASNDQKSGSVFAILWQRKWPIICALLLGALLLNFQATRNQTPQASNVHGDSESHARIEDAEWLLRQLNARCDEARKEVEEAQSEYEKAHAQIRDISHLAPADLRTRISVNENERLKLWAERKDIEYRREFIYGRIADRTLLDPNRFQAGKNAKPSLNTDAMDRQHLLEQVLFLVEQREKELSQRKDADQAELMALRKHKEDIKGPLKANEQLQADPLDSMLEFVLTEFAASAEKIKLVEQMIDQDRQLEDKLDRAIFKQIQRAAKLESARKKLDDCQRRIHFLQIDREQPASSTRAANNAIEDNLRAALSSREAADHEWLDLRNQLDLMHEKIRAVSPWTAAELRGRMAANEIERTKLQLAKINLKNSLGFFYRTIADGRDRDGLLPILKQMPGLAPFSGEILSIAAAERRTQRDAIAASLSFLVKEKENELTQQKESRHPEVVSIRERVDRLQRIETEWPEAAPSDLLLNALARRIREQEDWLQYIGARIDADRRAVGELEKLVALEDSLTERSRNRQKDWMDLDARIFELQIQRDRLNR